MANDRKETSKKYDLWNRIIEKKEDEQNHPDSILTKFFKKIRVLPENVDQTRDSTFSLLHIHDVGWLTPFFALIALPFHVYKLIRDLTNTKKSTGSYIKKTVFNALSILVAGTAAVGIVLLGAVIAPFVILAAAAISTVESLWQLGKHIVHFALAKKEQKKKKEEFDQCILQETNDQTFLKKLAQHRQLIEEKEELLKEYELKKQILEKDKQFDLKALKLFYELNRKDESSLTQPEKDTLQEYYKNLTFLTPEVRYLLSLINRIDAKQNEIDLFKKS